MDGLPGELVWEIAGDCRDALALRAVNSSLRSTLDHCVNSLYADDYMDAFRIRMGGAGVCWRYSLRVKSKRSRCVPWLRGDGVHCLALMHCGRMCTRPAPAAPFLCVQHAHDIPFLMCSSTL